MRSLPAPTSPRQGLLRPLTILWTRGKGLSVPNNFLLVSDYLLDCGSCSTFVPKSIDPVTFLCIPGKQIWGESKCGVNFCLVNALFLSFFK
jgi:hypothetical protein